MRTVPAVEIVKVANIDETRGKGLLPKNRAGVMEISMENLADLIDSALYKKVVADLGSANVLEIKHPAIGIIIAVQSAEGKAVIL